MLDTPATTPQLPTYRERALAHCRLVLDALLRLLSSVGRRQSPTGNEVASSDTPDELADPAARDAFYGLLDSEDGQALRLGIELPASLVARRYGLSALELGVLWLSLAPHLEPRARKGLAAVTGNPLYDFASGEICLDLLFSPALRLEAQILLGGGGRLQRSGLLRAVPRDVGATNPLLHELVPAGHLAAHFTGTRSLSPELFACARWLRPQVTLDDLPPLAGMMAPFVPVLEGFYDHPVAACGWHGPHGLDLTRGIGLVVHGPHGSGRLLAIRGLAGALRRDLIVADGSHLRGTSLAEARTWVTRLFQEAELYGELLVFRQAELLVGTDAPLADALAEALASRAVAALFCADSDLALHPSLEARVLLRQAVTAPSDPRSAAFLWQVSTPAECLIPPELDFEPITGRLQLSPTQIRNAAHLAYLLARAERRGVDAPPDEEASHDSGLMVNQRAVETAARAQAAGSIGQLAEITEPTVALHDIILPEDTASELAEVLDAVRNRRKVLDEWGLGRRLRRGLGICCLFDGEPGTGKTLAAEIIASELGLRLLRINAAEVVDKYIGETEKNLARIFACTRPDTHLLLFDEADSLFSKRTEVSRSTDRYANLEINLLLQLLERYEGVTVLTTNLRRGIDTAFERRFTFKIHFPLPETAERERIWHYFLDGSGLLEGPIDCRALAALELSGGEIKNAVVKAAYAAAHCGHRVTAATLFEAAEREAVSNGHLVRVGPRKPERILHVARGTSGARALG